MTGWPILSLVVFSPLVGAALILFVPSSNHRLIRGVALMAALASLVFSLRLLGYQPDGAEFQYREDISWIAAFGMRYTLGVDGLSVWFVLLTLAAVQVCIAKTATSRSRGSHTKRARPMASSPSGSPTPGGCSRSDSVEIGGYLAGLTS